MCVRSRERVCVTSPKGLLDNRIASFSTKTRDNSIIFFFVVCSAFVLFIPISFCRFFLLVRHYLFLSVFKEILHNRSKNCNCIVIKCLAFETNRFLKYHKYFPFVEKRKGRSILFVNTNIIYLRILELLMFSITCFYHC